MSFHLYYSNHLDTLQYIAGYITKVDPQDSPFDREYFLVQNFGMARWMQIKLAKQLGILTQAEFLLPSKMLINLLERIFTKEELEAHPIERLSKDDLFWPLVKILQEIVEDPAEEIHEQYQPILQYLEKYQQQSPSNKIHPNIGTDINIDINFENERETHEQNQFDTTSKSHPLNDGMKRAILHLSAELAAIFDKYIVYRSQWINAWSQGELAPPYFDESLPPALEKWQASLFERLYNSLGRPRHLGMMHSLIEQKLADPSIKAHLPKRIFIIGLNSLPPLFLELIVQFSKVIDIHLFFNNPSQYYWGDLIKGETPQFNYYNFFTQLQSQINPLSPHLPVSIDQLDEHWQNSYGHPLLASLGKVGRDHLHLLQQYDGTLELNVTEAFSEPEVKHLLSKIQNEIYHLRPLKESEKFPLTPDDRSIQLHINYSPMREVEALYNQILRELDHNPDLSLEEIVVMTPNIEEYAPFIDAVFGSAPKERYLPYSISDISLKESDTIFSALLQILTLPESAFKASDLLTLLQLPEIMEKFQFSESDIALIQFWISDVNIKQAIDGLHLTEALALPYDNQFEWDINTWRWGLQRMLLGYGSTRTAFLFEKVKEGEKGEGGRLEISASELNDPHFQSANQALLPYPYVEGKNAEILGRLCHLIDQLTETRDALIGEKGVADWLLILPEIWQRFFTLSTTNQDKLHFTQKIWHNILSGARAIDYSTPLPLNALVPLLEQKLLEEKPEQNFIQGKITFCSFIPMRTIPFKMVAMIGMNQADFPKTAIHHSFDLMQYQRMRGDRQRSSDDRYLFLEAILSAKEILYLSYIGRSIQDNSECFPSLLIDELMRYIDQIASTENGVSPTKNITFEHPMAPYNEQLFDPQSPIQSFQSEWSLSRDIKSFYHAPYSYPMLLESYQKSQALTPLTEISLHTLIKFYQDPTQYFAEHRLTIPTYNSRANNIEDDEIFAIQNHLELYQFNRRVTNDLLREALYRPQNSGALETDFLSQMEQNLSTDDNRSSTSLTQSPSTQSLAAFAKQLFKRYRLEGSLPKFAYGDLLWEEKQILPLLLASKLLSVQYPYGQWRSERYQRGITLYGQLPELTPDGLLIMWDVGEFNERRRIAAAITNLFFHATKESDRLHENLLYFSRKGDLIEEHPLPYYPQADAAQLLNHLIDGFLYGISAPIPYYYTQDYKPAFSHPSFTEILEALQADLPHLFTEEIESNELAQTFVTLLQDEHYINSLPTATRNLLNRVKSSFTIQSSFERLFPDNGAKEMLAFFLFYYHYLRELVTYES